MSRLAIRIGLVLLMAAPPLMGQAVVQGKLLEAVQGKKLSGKLSVFEGMLAFKGDALTMMQWTVKGTFWRDPQWIALLGLSADQQKKMEDIFREHRLKLIDLTASLQKNELLLAPMIEALPAGDEARIVAQIDRVAQDRAELEKANSRMLLGLLQALTPDQWTKLRERKE